VTESVKHTEKKNLIGPSVESESFLITFESNYVYLIILFDWIAF